MCLEWFRVDPTNGPCWVTLYIRQFKHQTLFATQTQTQCNLIMNTNPMYRICHTPISHWLRNLGI